VLCCNLLYCAVLCCDLFCFMLHFAALCCVVWSCAVLCSDLCCIVLCVVLCCALLCCSPDCLQTFKHPDLVSSLAFHPSDDRFFVTGCFDKLLRLWDTTKVMI
jgi:WD40 repeat protein